MRFMELVPDYYDEFHCQCGACSYTCCQEWPIAITEKDYKNLMSFPLPEEEHALLEKTFLRDPWEGQPGHLYAFIRFQEDGKCGFQTADGLCRLQQLVGEENLMMVCRKFPRTAAFIFGSTLEKDLRLSCPAVVELLLKKEAGIRYVTRAADEEVAYHLVGRLKGHKKQRHINFGSPAAMPQYLFQTSMGMRNKLLRYYWEMKTLLIGVLQNRDYTIHQRILYMGVLLRTFIKLDEEQRSDEAGALALAEMEREDVSDIMDTLSRLPQNDPLALDWLSNLANLRHPIQLRDASTRQEAKQLRERLKMEWRDDKFMISRSALALGKKHFAEFCESHPHVAENMAVAIFQVDAMPFGGIYKNANNVKIDLWRNYRWFCAQFAVWQLFMRSRFVEEIPDDREIARITAVVMRCLPNMQEFLMKREQNMTPGVIADPLEIISILIK